MKVEKSLKMPAQTFYQFLIRSVLQDIQAETGQVLSATKLAGFHYTKHFDANLAAEIHIKQAEAGKKYHFQTKSPKQTFDVCYTIQALDAQHCQVCYEEQVTGTSYLTTLSKTPVGKLVETKKKAQMLKVFTLMEEQYQH